MQRIVVRFAVTRERLILSCIEVIEARKARNAVLGDIGMILTTKKEIMSHLKLMFTQGGVSKFEGVVAFHPLRPQAVNIINECWPGLR